jgi:hypothetical protein
VKRETPAVTAITRTAPDGGQQTIYSCAAHQFRTIAEFRKLGDEQLAVGPADPAHHGCKGCLEDWATP